MNSWQVLHKGRYVCLVSRASAVCTTTGYELDGREFGVPVPRQAHPASYQMRNLGSFCGGKTADT
jgi:hypothetical protein